MGGAWPQQGAVICLELAGVVPNCFRADLFLYVPVFNNLATFQPEQVNERPIIVTLFCIAVDNDKIALPQKVVDFDILRRLPTFHHLLKVLTEAFHPITHFRTVLIVLFSRDVVGHQIGTPIPRNTLVFTR